MEAIQAQTGWIQCTILRADFTLLKNIWKITVYRNAGLQSFQRIMLNFLQKSVSFFNVNKIRKFKVVVYGKVRSFVDN